LNRINNIISIRIKAVNDQDTAYSQNKLTDNNNKKEKIDFYT